MNVEKYCHLKVENTAVLGGVEKLAILFSQNLSGILETGGMCLSDLEAGICENSAPETPHSRRSGQVGPVSFMGNSRICG
ncbi:hypothetical protein JMK10_19655 [Rhodovulum sulfidophilum]|uniref:hypothetical protein n=1 Tax=Rhodovulum sulfidophilum TaxID=35806 RepID=UPI0019218390|nr:hypothetical protein [Rhodovulum sulfidophilum]MBL3575981.1 hypothetical protein [Rhodovulum sulfidophilum]MCE8433086.1 hypothetical protein [Rhodovulum sulfidophilum]MCF4118934.1 hypothetical protein [Rhodovulum sulfidophilum]